MWFWEFQMLLWGDVVLVTAAFDPVSGDPY